MPIHAVSPAPARRGKGSIAAAGRVRVGDAILSDGEFRLVTAVRRAQGRKPKIGENLHLSTGDTLMKVNSLEPVRIRRP